MQRERDEEAGTLPAAGGGGAELSVVVWRREPCPTRSRSQASSPIGSGFADFRPGLGCAPDAPVGPPLPSAAPLAPTASRARRRGTPTGGERASAGAAQAAATNVSNPAHFHVCSLSTLLTFNLAESDPGETCVDEVLVDAMRSCSMQGHLRLSELPGCAWASAPATRNSPGRSRGSGPRRWRRTWLGGPPRRAPRLPDRSGGTDGDSSMLPIGNVAHFPRC